MEFLDYLLNLSALHYLAMAFVLGTLAFCFYNAKIFTSLIFIIIFGLDLVFHRLNIIWTTLIFIWPVIIAALILCISLYNFIKIKAVGIDKVNLIGVIKLISLNLILILGAIGGFGYYQKQQRNELKELIPICQKTDLIEIKKTGIANEFVDQCEKALKLN